jgi:hypothetical protein
MWSLDNIFMVIVCFLNKVADSDASNEVTTSSKAYSGATGKDYSGATGKDYSGTTSKDYSGATGKDYTRAIKQDATTKDYTEATTTYLDYSDLALQDAFNGSFLTKNNYRGLYTNASYFPGNDQN